MWQSLDGGDTWQLVDRTATLPDPPCDHIQRKAGARYRLDDNHEWLVCEAFQHYTCSQDAHDLLFSADGGATWRVIADWKYSASVANLVFTTPDDGWIAGGACSGALLRTRDGGLTWAHVEHVDFFTVGGRVEFTDRLHGRVLTRDYRGPAAWITDDGGETWRLISLATTPTP